MIDVSSVDNINKQVFEIPIFKKEYVKVRANNIIEATERAKCLNDDYFIKDCCQAYSYFISTDKSKHNYEYNNLKIAIEDMVFFLTIMKFKNAKLWKKTLFHKSNGSYCTEKELLWSDETGTSAELLSLKCS